ncbi:response regulator [Aquabacter sp. CN5-332]|uniref:response regulator n=1 Tax=Aquabacter sp. CN5-332 TaxID=3156608 RepID=UPI0032B58497
MLIVEDELLVALGLEDNLRSLGCEVIGPVASLSEAKRVAETVAADVAILDVNLRGEYVYPAAEILAARGIPLIFCSGFIGTTPLPEQFAGAVRVPKPYTSRAIANALSDILSRTSGDAGPAFLSAGQRHDAHI